MTTLTHPEWRRQMAAALRAGDEELAKRLSQLKEQAKRWTRRRCQWPGCGIPVTKRSYMRSGEYQETVHCRMHSVAHRNRRLAA